MRSIVWIAAAAIIALGGVGGALAQGMGPMTGPMTQGAKPAAGPTKKAAPRAKKPALRSAKGYRGAQRTAGCGKQFHYWSGGKCVDARLKPPKLN
jgi:hypothetical protein